VVPAAVAGVAKRCQATGRVVTLDEVADTTTGKAAYRVAAPGEVVPRSAWPARTLRDGQAVEVLTAVQGG